MVARKLLTIFVCAATLVIVGVAALKTGVIKSSTKQVTVTKGNLLADREQLHLGTGNKSCPNCIVFATPNMITKAKSVVGIE